MARFLAAGVTARPTLREGDVGPGCRTGSRRGWASDAVCFAVAQAQSLAPREADRALAPVRGCMRGPVRPPAVSMLREHGCEHRDNGAD